MLSDCLSVFMSLHLPISRFVSLSVCLIVPFSLFLYLFLCLSVSLTVYVYLSVPLSDSVCIFFCLPIFFSLSHLSSFILPILEWLQFILYNFMQFRNKYLPIDNTENKVYREMTRMGVLISFYIHRLFGGEKKWLVETIFKDFLKYNVNRC